MEHGALRTDDSEALKADDPNHEAPSRELVDDDHSDGDVEDSIDATTIQTRTVLTQAFSGPLPPADELQQYGKAEPTAPDRIITMAEKEQACRHRSINRRELVNAMGFAGGHVIALVVSLFCIGGAIYLAILGQLFVPALLIGAPMLVHIRSFLHNRRGDSS